MSYDVVGVMHFTPSPPLRAPTAILLFAKILARKAQPDRVATSDGGGFSRPHYFRLHHHFRCVDSFWTRGLRGEISFNFIGDCFHILVKFFFTSGNIVLFAWDIFHRTPLFRSNYTSSSGRSEIYKLSATIYDFRIIHNLCASFYHSDYHGYKDITIPVKGRKTEKKYWNWDLQYLRIPP